MADQVSIQIAEPIVGAGSAVTATVNCRTRSTAAASTPSSIRYRVDCLTNRCNVINWTSVSAASSASITVPGTSNGTIDYSQDLETRQITVEIDTGLSTQVRAAATWKVRTIRNYVLQHEFQDDLQLEAYNPITAAETAAGVTPTSFQYPPGDVRRYGAVGDGVTDDTDAIQNAIDVGLNVVLYDGVYLANNLTQDTNFQNIIGIGKVHIRKNANGALMTSSGDDVLFRNIDFRDDGEDYTGKGLVCSGDRVRVEYCGGYLIEDTALEITGAAPQVIGTCNIWRTRTAAGYDISIGVSGTVTLYARVSNIYTSSSDGGIRFIDCGSNAVSQSQFGKLFVDAGTSPAGVNGGTYSNNRILGDVTVEISNSDFSANTFGAITITLGSGTSGHHFGASNTYDASCTITDNSTESTIIDTRESSMKSYTPSWTGATDNPAIGDGTLSGRYMKVGKMVHVWVRMLAGSTTTFGTGAWFFSLPFAPATFGTQVGSIRVLDSGTAFRTGVAQTLSDGTARVQATIDSDTASIDSGRPMTWASGDELYISITYLTN